MVSSTVEENVKHLSIVQITDADVQRSSTLEAEDVGRWCFVLNEALVGFYASREEAEHRARQFKAGEDYHIRGWEDGRYGHGKDNPCDPGTPEYEDYERGYIAGFMD